MKFVSVTQLSAIGKGVIAFIVGAFSLMQVPQVAAVVTAMAHDHPHVAIAVGMVTTLATLLVNPQVQKIIGYVPTLPADPASK